jgi:2-haloacid dehalogenase
VAIDAVIFDFGGVLMDWNPDYLYRKLIPDPRERQHFLAEICNGAWNAEQDRGRPWSEAVATLSAIHPDKAAFIAAYRERWIEMLAGPIADCVKLAEQLHRAGVPLYGLTNWSSETFELARGQMPYLPWLRDTVVSGQVGLAKPDAKIFRLLLERNDLTPANTVLIDDHRPNIVAAEALGLHAIHHRDATATGNRLRAMGLKF